MDSYDTHLSAADNASSVQDNVDNYDTHLSAADNGSSVEENDDAFATPFPAPLSVATPRELSSEDEEGSRQDLHSSTSASAVFCHLNHPMHPTYPTKSAQVKPLTGGRRRRSSYSTRARQGGY